MTLEQAYARRVAAQKYMQQVARPIGKFDPEARANAIAKARTAFQNADQYWRDLCAGKKTKTPKN